MHPANLISDLGVILAIAGVVSLIFHRIRQPVVLGYICAGLLASWLTGAVHSEIHTLAELGVIFLMFSLGLEFSFRKVVRLGASVAFVSLFEVACVFGTGAWLGTALGWSSKDAFFLGAMLAISSTTIIVKALDEFGLKNRRFAQNVMGILVFEDLIAILMIVALGGVASGAGVSTGALGHSLGTLILFVGGWFLVGTFLLPPVLKHVGRANSEEMLMVLAVGLCLGLSLLASRLGYSAGLGAFLMGSILAESSESRRIEQLVRPLRDLFAAIFFVTVGLMIDPMAIGANWGSIVILSAFVIGAKFLFVTIGSVLAGNPLKKSILVGGCFTQIGEFSFIIAGMGVVSGVLAPSLQPIVVAVSVLTTLVTPYSIRFAPRVVRPIEGLLPLRLRSSLETYSAWSERRASESEADPELRRAGLRWALSGFIVTLVSRLAMHFATPWVGAGVALIILPFLWGFLRGVRVEARDRAILSQVIATGSQVVALVICAILAWPFFRGTPVTWAIALVSVVLVVRFVGRIGKAFFWFESTFLATLSSGREKSEASRSVLRKLAPWEGQLVRLKVHADSEVSGKTIQDVSLRGRFGLNIVAIQRGSRLMVAPSPGQQLFPKDEILVLGEEDRVERARKFIELGAVSDEREQAIEGYELRAIEVTDQSPCLGKTLRDSEIPNRYAALVVGIERGGRRLINPDSATQIQAGDVLWVVGGSERLTELVDEMIRLDESKAP